MTVANGPHSPIAAHAFIIMGILERIGLKRQQPQDQANSTALFDTAGRSIDKPFESFDIFKAYIPEFLYKPPYGYPRKTNLPYIKLLAKTPYVFSIIKTLCDEASAVDWNIQVKDEYQDDGVDYQQKIKEIRKFFNNPNGNDESLGFILRALITGILEIDAGVIVKVFNRKGELSQIYARDGATFLKNPDQFGSIENRDDFVAPINPNLMYSDNVTKPNYQNADQLRNLYDTAISPRAAYFQYGWTAGSMPVPFGKREIVYIISNPRPDSIYGRAVIEVLESMILTLVYGSKYNLGFYANNNMPEGAITLTGADRTQISNFRANFENQFKETDEFGVKRKSFFKFPISSQEVKFTPFQIMSKDLEIISQQEWFFKVLMASFGVTPEEMGFTENSNRAVAHEAAKVVKRKALRPILKLIEYHINTQIMTEFFGNIDYSDCPLEFTFNYYDIEEDFRKHELIEKQINMGVLTPEMAAKELGINVDELMESKMRQSELAQSNMENQGFNQSNQYEYINLDKKTETKHKYISRTGSSGNYQYKYQEDAAPKKRYISEREARIVYSAASNEQRKNFLESVGVTSGPSWLGLTMSDKLKVISAINKDPSLLESSKKPESSKKESSTAIKPHQLPDDADYNDYFRYAKGQGISTADAADWAAKQVLRKQKNETRDDTSKGKVIDEDTQSRIDELPSLMDKVDTSDLQGITEAITSKIIGNPKTAEERQLHFELSDVLLGYAQGDNSKEDVMNAIKQAKQIKDEIKVEKKNKSEEKTLETEMESYVDAVEKTLLQEIDKLSDFEK